MVADWIQNCIFLVSCLFASTTQETNKLSLLKYFKSCFDNSYHFYKNVV